MWDSGRAHRSIASSWYSVLAQASKRVVAKSVCNMAEGYYQWTRTGPRDEDGYFRWRPFVYRCKHRSHFAGQSGAANSGAIEPAEATPARTRDAETPQESSDASDASAAEPSAEVLLGIAELQRLQQGGVGKGRLHKEARHLLNEKSRFFLQIPRKTMSDPCPSTLITGRGGRNTSPVTRMLPDLSAAMASSR